MDFCFIQKVQKKKGENKVTFARRKKESTIHSCMLELREKQQPQQGGNNAFTNTSTTMTKQITLIMLFN